jgi:hypothetical protein
MAFRFRRVVLKEAEPREPSGGWYADPFGSAARRWYDDRQGWTDRVQGPGLEPDKTGVARIDEPVASINDPIERVDADATPAAVRAAAPDDLSRAGA